MKKLIFLFILFCMPTVVMAVDMTPGLSSAWSNHNSLLSAVTGTGSGSTVLLHQPQRNHMCTAIWRGTAPTDITFSVDGSEDGKNFGALATVTMTATPTIFHIDKPSVLFLRGTYTAKTGGDATTSLTLTCTSGGN